MLKKYHLISVVLWFFAFLNLLPETTSGAIPAHWNKRSFDLSAVAYGNGIFVAVGGKGRIQTSSDGVSGKIQTSGTTETLKGIAFGGTGKLVAVGGEGKVATSPNGIT